MTICWRLLYQGKVANTSDRCNNSWQQRADSQTAVAAGQRWSQVPTHPLVCNKTSIRCHYSCKKRMIRPSLLQIGWKDVSVGTVKLWLFRWRKDLWRSTPGTTQSTQFDDKKKKKKKKKDSVLLPLPRFSLLRRSTWSPVPQLWQASLRRCQPKNNKPVNLQILLLLLQLGDSAKGCVYRLRYKEQACRHCLQWNSCVHDSGPIVFLCMHTPRWLAPSPPPPPPPITKTDYSYIFSWQQWNASWSCKANGKKNHKEKEQQRLSIMEKGSSLQWGDLCRLTLRSEEVVKQTWCNITKHF